MEYKRTHKKFTKERYWNSFQNSLAGFIYSFRYEQNMIVIVFSALLVIVAGFLFHISFYEWLFCIIIIGMIAATELMNTAIEAVVDLASPKRHPIAKIAKDTASAAVFVYVLVAIIGGMIIFVPKILEVFF